VDLATILGIVIALVGILVGQAIEGGSVIQILQPTAAMIVFGGTIGATMIGFPLSVMKQAAADLLHVFKEEIVDPSSVIDEVIRFANKARREASFRSKRMPIRLKTNFSKSPS